MIEMKPDGHAAIVRPEVQTTVFIRPPGPDEPEDDV